MYSDESYLLKTFSIFVTSLCWQKIHVSSAYKQQPASDNDWGRSFTYNEKQSSPRVKLCGTPYFNVLASGKTSTETLKKIGLKPFNHMSGHQNISFFEESYGQKYQMLSEDLLISSWYASIYPYQLNKVYHLSQTKVR